MNFVLKQPARSDRQAVAELINAHSLAVVGTRRALLDSHGELRTARYIPGAAEQIVVMDAAGAMAAHAWWASRPPHVVVETGVSIHPDYWTTNIAEVVIHHCETQARASLDKAPDGARVVLQSAVLANDISLIDTLHKRGFAPAREWVHFELTLVEPPAAIVPEGVTIREMDQRFDWLAVGAVIDAAFADHWGEMGPHVRTLLEEDVGDGVGEKLNEDAEEELEDDPYSNSLGLCFVAEVDGAVVGACLCNARTVEWSEAGKLGSLSVLREFRRLGVGHALTATALAEFHSRGIRRVITDTDSASFTGANRLYPRFGFSPYRYEHVYEMELRAGVEWRSMNPDGLQK